MAYEIRVKELRSVFDPSTPDFSAIVVRLSVLFEDLRIEYLASRSPGLADIDVVGSG